MKRQIILILLIIAFNAITNKYNDAMKSPKINILVINNSKTKPMSHLEKLKTHINSISTLSDFYEIVETDCNELLDFCDLEGIPRHHDVIIQPRYTCSNKIGFDMASSLPRFYTDLSRMEKFVENNRDKVHLVFNYPNEKEAIKNRINTLIVYLEKRLVGNINSYGIITHNTNKTTSSLKLEQNLSYIVKDGRYEPLSFENLLDVDPAILVDEINRFLIKPVEILNQESVCRIYSSGIQTKIYLLKKQEKCSMLSEAFEETALHNIKHDLFKDRLQFVEVNLNDHEDKDGIIEIVSRHLGDDILNSSICDVLIVGYKRGGYVKNKLDKLPYQVNKDTLVDFIDAFNSNAIEAKYVKSEYSTFENQVVANNFKDKVIKSENDVFLLVCETKDRNCNILTRFSKFMVEKSKANVDFYFLDYSKNEIEYFDIKVFPMFLVYKVGKKRAPEMFRVDFSYEALAEFYNKWIGGFDFGDSEKIEFLGYIKEYIPEADRIKLEEMFAKGADFSQDL